MQVTEVRIVLRNEDKLKGFANVTFDHEFVVRGMKIIEGVDGLFVSMPSRRRADGSFQDIAHPVTAEMRRKIEEQILQAFQQELQREASRTTGAWGVDKW